jgi:RHS repeat-associated protein
MQRWGVGALDLKGLLAQPGTGTYVADFDGDGRQDLLVTTHDGLWLVGRSDGIGQLNFGVAYNAGGDLQGVYHRDFVADFDGDGKPDHLLVRSDGTYYLGISQGPLGDLLTSVQTPLGGVTTVAYTSSRDAEGRPWAWDNNPPLAPMVSAVTVNDARGHVATSTFLYGGGIYDHWNRRFLGYRWARKTDPCLPGESACPMTDTYLKQDFASVGKPEAVWRIRGDTGAAVSGTWFNYQTNTTAPLVSLMNMRVEHDWQNASTECQSWPCASGQRRATSWGYDFFGNVQDEVRWGDFDQPGDETVLTHEYVPNAGAYIVDKPFYDNLFDAVADANHNLTARWDVLLAQTLYYYDYQGLRAAPAVGNLTNTMRWVSTSGGYVQRQRWYDGVGNVVAEMDETNAITRTSWDGWGLYPNETLDALGHRTQRSFDPVCGAIATETDPNGQVTRLTYDALCRLQEKDTPGGGYERSGYYDSDTTVCTWTPAPANQTELWRCSFHDGLGRPTTTARKGAGQDIWQLAVYNARGGIAARSEPYYANDPVFWTGYDYDAQNRLVQTRNPDGTAVQRWYAPSAVVTVDEQGHQQRDLRDGYGRVVNHGELHGGQWISTAYAFDKRGNPSAVADGAGNVWSFAVDSLGRRLSLHDPDAGDWSFGYDNLGRVTGWTDAKGQQANLAYDALGRLVAKTFADGSGLTGITRAYNTATGEHFYTTSAEEAGAASFTVESVNYFYLHQAAIAGTVPFYRCYVGSVGKHFYTASASCEGTGATNEGALGNIATSQLAGTVPLYRLYYGGNGDHFYTISAAERDLVVSAGFQYEGLVGYVWTVGPVAVQWRYDEQRTGYANIGRLTSASDGSGRAVFDYDAAGRRAHLGRTTDGHTYDIWRAYDTGGRLVVDNYPESPAASTTYQYDAAGRVVSIPGVVDQVVYDASDRMTGQWNSNQTVTTRTFTPRGLVHSIATTVRGQTIQSLSYGQDLEGRITQISSPFPGEGNTYAYDDQHHLVSAAVTTDASLGQNFGYDAVGNITAATGVGNYVYPTPGQARPHAPTSVGSLSYLYDQNGNTVISAGRAIVYDAENQVVAIDDTRIGYDGDGNRLWRQAGGVRTYYLGDDFEVRDSITTRTLTIDGRPVARRSGGRLEWLHLDHLDTVSVVTDAQGNVTERDHALAYRQPLGTTGTSEVDAGDGDEGLLWMHARYYDPFLGRFLSPDPAADPEHSVDLSNYAYAGDDPINRVDPEGATDYGLLRPFSSYAIPRYGVDVSGVTGIPGDWAEPGSRYYQQVMRSLVPAGSSWQNGPGGASDIQWKPAGLDRRDDGPVISGGNHPGVSGYMPQLFGPYAQDAGITPFQEFYAAMQEASEMSALNAAVYFAAQADQDRARMLAIAASRRPPPPPPRAIFPTVRAEGTVRVLPKPTLPGRPATAPPRGVSGGGQLTVRGAIARPSAGTGLRYGASTRGAFPWRLRPQQIPSRFSVGNTIDEIMRNVDRQFPDPGVHASLGFLSSSERGSLLSSTQQLDDEIARILGRQSAISILNPNFDRAAFISREVANLRGRLASLLPSRTPAQLDAMLGLGQYWETAVDYRQTDAGIQYSLTLLPTRELRLLQIAQKAAAEVLEVRSGDEGTSFRSMADAAEDGKLGFTYFPSTVNGTMSAFELYGANDPAEFRASIYRSDGLVNSTGDLMFLIPTNALLNVAKLPLTAGTLARAAVEASVEITVNTAIGGVLTEAVEGLPDGVKPAVPVGVLALALWGRPIAGTGFRALANAGRELKGIGTDLIREGLLRALKMPDLDQSVGELARIMMVGRPTSIQITTTELTAADRGILEGVVLEWTRRRDAMMAAFQRGDWAGVSAQLPTAARDGNGYLLGYTPGSQLPLIQVFQYDAARIAGQLEQVAGRDWVMSNGRVVSTLDLAQSSGAYDLGGYSAVQGGGRVAPNSYNDLFTNIRARVALDNPALLDADRRNLALQVLEEWGHIGQLISRIASGNQNISPGWQQFTSAYPSVLTQPPLAQGEVDVFRQLLPVMNFGDMMEFVARHPEADRVSVIRDLVGDRATYSVPDLPRP